MKRIFLACFLLTATCAVSSQKAAAQTTTVSASDFTAKVNLLDAQIASGDMTSAATTWSTLNTMMKTELSVTKMEIMNATTTADKTTYTTLNRNQVGIYKTIWGLKDNLAANRNAIHTQLGLFGTSI